MDTKDGMIMPPTALGQCVWPGAVGMLVYAGIGSRSTPEDVLQLMHRAAVYLGRKGYLLRSGGAVGADTAFEKGARLIAVNEGGRVPEIYLADHATPEALRMAAQIHPNWQACSSYAKRLHARNCMQILGENLDEPVQFVLCWTPNAEAVGGTRTAIVLAQNWGIPVLNLANPAHRARVETKLTDLPF